MKNVYERLAAFLDDLPAGYPRTESGVELRILRKLFTQEEAELFMHLSLLGETARVVALRAGLPEGRVSEMLAALEAKGLIAGSSKAGQPVEYSASQFVIGFYEDQVNRVDRALAELFEEYLPALFNGLAWNKAPQLRTIPIGASIPIQAEVMPYDRAEEIVAGNSVIAVSPCVCRQERQALGHTCGKPMETCLVFGPAAERKVHNGRARAITRDEALAILHRADEAGLVLQPANSKAPVAICACCGCCCGVLRGLKLQEKPSEAATSAYIARHNPDLCTGCGACLDRCQMDAISLPEFTAVLDLNRCIGCGLCVTGCPSGAFTLERKPEAAQPAIPADTARTYIRLASARGKLGKLARMAARSGFDRIRARS